jgi:hypothetical protein
LKTFSRSLRCTYIMAMAAGNADRNGTLSIEENNKIDTLWYTLEASLLAWYSFLLVMLPQKLVIWRIIAQKSSIYFGNFELHSFACEKNNARVIARNETGPSINRRCPTSGGVPRQKQSQTCAEGTVTYL